MSEFSQEHGAKGDGHLDWKFSSRPCRPSHPVSKSFRSMFVAGLIRIFAFLFNDIKSILGTWTANWATALFITRRTEKPWWRYGNQLEEKMSTSFKQAQSKLIWLTFKFIWVKQIFISFFKKGENFMPTQYCVLREANDGLMELLIMSYTCKTSSCKSVIGVIPYLPYSQQSKLNLIVSITKTILYSVI